MRGPLAPAPYHWTATEPRIRTLSSAQTVLVKLIFPPAWFLGFGAGALALWSASARLQGGADPLMPSKWLFLIAWVAGSAFIYWGCVRLKRVQLDGSTLLISNYRTTIVVPLRDVESVTENRWINTHPVTLHLRRPTDFGSDIMFMPTVRLFGFWSSHPVVGELRELIRDERLLRASSPTA